MTKPSLFNFERFLSLSGSELVNYVEPFITTQIDAIPESAYDLLQSGLADFDEYHTVYALEICMLLKPSEFIRCAVEFLSHTDSAVCCAACRVIKKLPSTLVTADLAGKIAATPIVDLFTAHVRSGNRIRIGTNEEFIHSLLEKFAQ